jgi:hypothetical protein
VTKPKEITTPGRWPEVGKIYLGAYASGLAIRPNLGWPVHAAARFDELGPGKHNHCNPRFFTVEQEAALARDWRGSEAPAKAHGWPRHRCETQRTLKGVLAFDIGAMPGDKFPRARHLPLLCRYASLPWAVPARHEYWPEHEKYVSRGRSGGVARALKGSKGHPLCPLSDVRSDLRLGRHELARPLPTAWAERGCEHVLELTCCRRTPQSDMQTW